MAKTVLEVLDLKTSFFTRRGEVKAVDGVSFSVKEGQTLGLVGESGCGKSITCLSIIRLVPRPAGRIVGGQVMLEGKDLLQLPESQMREVRGRKISMILQDPMTSLNPVFSIGELVGEPISIHQRTNNRSISERVIDILRRVRIPSPETRVRDYPHQMSGGMRQRIVAAMALSCEPRLLIADEPTSALDVTIQVQFLRLLKEIQQQSGVAMIMVTHDFGIVARICDIVAVMYAGKIVEFADVRELLHHPAHPYTVALMNSVPKIGAKRERLYSIEGQPPDLAFLPPGCSFAARCSQATETCHTKKPAPFPLRDGHEVACWLYGEGAVEK